MHKIAKQSIVFLLIAVLVLIPFSTTALAESQKLNDENSAEAMAADLFIVRPLGIVATLVGSAIFVVSLPFSTLGGNTNVAYQKLVKDPAKFTFKRALGDF